MDIGDWNMDTGDWVGSQDLRTRENQGGLYHVGAPGPASPRSDAANRAGILAILVPAISKETASHLRSPP